MSIIDEITGLGYTETTYTIEPIGKRWELVNVQRLLLGIMERSLYMNSKRILALGLAGMLSLSSFNAFAAETTDEKGKALYDLGLFQGYSKTEMKLGLADSLTREQAVKLTLSFLGYDEEDLDLEGKSSFTDGTKATAWAEPWVKFATELGLTSGVSETEFGYGKPVTKHQITTFMLRALGYDNAWEKAAELGLQLDLLSASDIVSFEENSVRGDFAGIGYNALAADVVDASTTLIEKLVKAEAVDQKAAEELGLIKEEVSTFEVASVESLNLAETKVEFTKDLDEKADNKENFTNFKVNKKSVKGIKKLDDKTLILFHAAVENGKTVKVEIKDVKDVDGDKLAKSTTDVKFLDTVLPTLEGAEVIGKDTIRLTFSEAMMDDNGLFNKKAFTITKENGSKVYLKNAVPAGQNNRQVDLKLLSSLKEEDYTIKVDTNITDYAKFGLIDSVTVSVEKDTEAPVVESYKDASQTSVTLVFDEDVEENGATANNFYHTNKSNKAKSIKVSGKEVEVTFADDTKLPQGTAYLFVDKEVLKDLWGNKSDDIKVEIAIEEDNEAPIVESVEQGKGNKLITVKFKAKDLNKTEAEKRSNYTVTDKDGKKVDIASAKLDGDKVTITLKKEVSGDVTLTIKNLKDKENNKMDEEDFTLTLDDKNAPKFPAKMEVVAVSGDENFFFTIKFDESGRMAEEGEYSVLDKDKYQVKYTDGTLKELKDIEDAELTLKEDGKSVVITIPAKDATKITAVSIARVADTEGNTTANLVKTYSGRLEIVVSNLIKTESAKAVDKNTIEVTLGAKVDDIDFEDFKFTKNGSEAKVGSTDVKEDKDGKTVLVFTMENELTASPAGYKFNVEKQNTKTIYGQRLQNVSTAVVDAIAPTLDKDATKELNANRTKRDMIYVAFDEILGLKTSNGAIGITDIKVTSESGDELVPATDFSAALAGKQIQITIKNNKYLDDTQFTVEIKDAKYISDNNNYTIEDRNTVNDFVIDVEVKEISVK